MAPTGRGWRHERGEAQATWRSRRAANAQTASRRARLRPRAPRRPRPSRRSPSTASSPTATRAPWSRPTARSTGSACRGSTRRASSAPCSTARTAPSASGPSGSTCPSARIYEPGTNIRRHHLAHADGLGADPRRAHHGPEPAARTGSRRTPGRRPTRTASICSCARRSASRAASSSSWSANRPSTTAARRPNGPWPVTTGRPLTRPAPGRRSACGPTCSSGSRATGSGRGTRSRRESRSSARSRGPRSWRRPRTSTRRTPGSPRPRTSGATGSPGPGCPTIAGGSRSSARRWRSRASPTCQPAPRSPRSRPRSPRRPGASAIGTTASPGCATRPSPCRRSTFSTSTGRRTSSCSSWPTSRRMRTGRCRSCTGSTDGAT